VKVTSPNTGTTLYVHDLAGNLTAKVEDLGGTDRTTAYVYDGLDRLTLVDFPSDPSWVLTYDTSAALNQKGRLASASNGVVTTELEYTPQGQLAVERTLIGGGSYAVTHTYDAAGNLATLTTPSGVTTAYAYSGSRPKEVTVTAGSESQTIREIEHLPFGPRTHAELPPEDGVTGDNTVLSTRQHNLRYQVTEIDVTTPAETVLDLSFTYDYTAGAPGPDDPGPNLDRVVDHRDASESRFYFYDELDRLWKAADLSGSPLYSYLYEPNGNRTQQASPAGTTSYGYATGTDLLTQATGAAAKHYASDPYGSRIWAGASAYAGTPSLVHDEANRLVEVRDPSTLAVLGAYTYDAFGRRVRKVAAGVTELFFYGPGAHLVEEQVPAAARAYVYLEEEPVVVVDRAAGGAPSFAWLHGDHLTTPRAVTTAPASGGAAVVWRATYAPFGLAEPDEDPDGDLQAFALDLRFPGQRFDAETELHDNFHRAYDPTVGRYLTADPIGLEGGLNEFAYVGGNPIALTDPLGLDFWVEGADPSELGYGFHQSICVGNYWKKQRFCISFGRRSGEGNCWFDCKGHVYQDVSPPAGIVFPMFHPTSPATDRKIREYLRSQLGKERPWDALGGENCRRFSQAMFRHLLSTYGAPPTPPLAKNPPSPGR
jgi:RHS repeat-associated protein